MKKHDPIIWATIDDALSAQDYERRGLTVITDRNAEGYIEVIGAYKLLTLPRAA